MQLGFKRDERGFTLMELIIVLAVIAIIGAILAPNFLTATERARLKSDIQSARVIQTAIETYNAEQTTALAPAADVKTSILSSLTGKGYLSEASGLTPQTDDAIWTYGADGIVKLNITGCDPKIRGDIYDALSDEEKGMVIK